MTLSDPLRPLFDAAVEGDDRAMAELVRRTQTDVWRLCSALGSRHEEEDLVQETYLRAMRSAATYRGDAPVRAWLLAIARNTCADHVRRRERQRKLLGRASAVGSDVQADHDDTHRLLHDLAPQRRDAFVLTQILGLSYEEASDTLGVPVGTIRSRVARARADLLAAVRAAQAV